MGQPKRISGRYTPPKHGGGLSMDLDVPGVTLTLPLSGSWAMPVEFAVWLDEAKLVDGFDAYLEQCRAEGRHGDAFTAFATEHAAPAAVLRAIAEFTG